MGNQDEFEGLIKNFKLDDIETPVSQTPAAPRRGVFDYDENNERFVAARERQTARAPQASAQATGPRAPERPAPRQTARAAAPRSALPPRQPVTQRAAVQGRYASPQQRSPEPGRRPQAGGHSDREKFQVNIDEREFYEPATARGGRGGDNSGGGNGGGNGGGEDDRRSGGAGRWAKAIFVLIVVLCVSVFLAFFALQSASDLFGLNKPDQQIAFDLPEGQSMAEVASLLHKQGIIMQPLTFQVYAGLKSDAEKFIPGSYVLNSKMSYTELIIAFVNHTTPKVEVRITFPEGLTLLEIAQKLEEKKVCTEEDLFEYLDKGAFPEKWGYTFLNQVPEDPNRFRRYEGYFFPDTYDFYENEDVVTVVQKFFNRFEEMTNTDKIKSLLKDNNLTLDQALTLASMIQKEAGKAEDMKDVSAVFHKRLANPSVQPHLGSDVTIFYVNDNIKPFLNSVNQQMFDAYNTYECIGLPVGPICNPGMVALNAALTYEPTDNYYFLADKDGNFYYAKTLDEHNANIRAAGITGVHGLDIPES